MAIRQAAKQIVGRLFAIVAGIGCLLAALYYPLESVAETGPRAQEAVFQFQRCAGMYYALAQFFHDNGTELGQDIYSQLLTDARVAETAAVHYLARLHRESHPNQDYSGELYAGWSTSVHTNSLTIANQTFHLLQQAGVSAIVQDLTPCNQLYALQNAVVRGRNSPEAR